MVQPKKKAGRLLPRTVYRCAYPPCNAKLTGKDRKYCDDICKKANAERMKVERRPKDLLCAACGAKLDPLSREPSEWKRTEQHFCDGICSRAYAQANGLYKERSLKGNEAIRAYKELHGHGHNYQERAEKITRNNTTRPPRAKMRRTALIWGYEASIDPNAARDGYIGSILDPEVQHLIGQVEAKTAKEVTQKLRARFTEVRVLERQTPEH